MANAYTINENEKKNIFKGSKTYNIPPETPKVVSEKRNLAHLAVIYRLRRNRYEKRKEKRERAKKESTDGTDHIYI